MTVSDLEYVVLRPPRRMLGRGVLAGLAGLGLAAAAVAAVLSGVWPQGAPFLAPWAAILVAGGVWQTVLALRGFTVAEPEGVRYRRFGRRVRVPWRDVHRFAAAPALWGRAVRLVRRDGRAVTLAAPRGRRTEDPEFEATVAGLQDVAARHVPNPGEGASTAETLIRRLSWRPVMPFIAVQGTIGLVAAVAGIVGFVTGGAALRFMWIIAVFVLLGMLFVVVATARARTEIRPQGIVNRALWTSTTIPWTDIAGIAVDVAHTNRAVTVRRRDGSGVILAALRDGPRAPDPLFDATVAAIRSRIPVRPEESDSAGAATGADSRGDPMSLRPSRLPLLVAFPSAAAATAAAAAGVLNNGTVVAVVLVVVALYLWRYVVVMLVGRTEIDAQGITNRVLVRRRHIPWGQVEHLGVQATPFGRSVQVTHRGRTRGESLAAPREGLLARDTGFADSAARLESLAAQHGRSLMPSAMSRTGVWATFGVVLIIVLAITAVVDPPWKRTWWPWLDEATTITEPCALPQAEALFDGPPERDSNDFLRTWRCGWEGEGANEWMSLDVEYALFEYSYGDSGTDKARGEVEWDREHADADTAELAGLGDEALRTAEPEATYVTVVARKANVVVTVDYSSPDAETEGVAEDVARAALDRLRLE